MGDDFVNSKAMNYFAISMAIILFSINAVGLMPSEGKKIKDINHKYSNLVGNTDSSFCYWMLLDLAIYCHSLSSFASSSDKIY